MGRPTRPAQGPADDAPAFESTRARPASEATGDLGFAWRLHKSGDVTITRGGREVTVLRGGAARAFEARIAGMPPDGQQTAMAKVTGSYKRGNERLASKHARNR